MGLIWRLRPAWRLMTSFFTMTLQGGCKIKYINEAVVKECKGVCSQRV